MSNNIFQEIDSQLGLLPTIRSGTGRYETAISAYLANPGDPAAFWNMCSDITTIAENQYIAANRGKHDIVRFEDRDVYFSFDIKTERVVFVFGLSRQVAKNSRDNNYHKGYPRSAGYEKGHYFSHAQGGFEGGPNYFRQKATLNRSISKHGKLWRQIEVYLAGHPGTLAFIRPLYPRGKNNDIPAEVEYGLFARGNGFRAVIFPNV